MVSSEVEKIFRAFAEERKRELPQYTPDGIPITLENKFDDAIYNYLYVYWKEHSGEYDPKKDVIPESEMNKMHPKTKNEFQFEKWLFEQYGMTSKEKTENTLMGNLNVLLEVSDVIDIAALPVGAIAVGAKLVGKKVIKEVGEKAVKEVAEGTVEKTVKEVAEETVEKTVKREAAEGAMEKTVKTEVSEEIAESTAKKELVDTAEDLTQKTAKKGDVLEDSSRVKGNSRASKELGKVPQGFTQAEYEKFAKDVTEFVKNNNLPEGKIMVHGSRAKGTATATSDVDIILRVDQQTFDKFVKQRLSTIPEGTRLYKTILKAAQKQKLSIFDISKDFGKNLHNDLKPLSPIKEIDFSIIVEDSPFDVGPFIDIN